MILLQILGTNGSGKSTLLRALAARDALAHTTTPPAFTVLPALKMVLIGDYQDPAVHTPGADRLSPKSRLLGALDDAALAARGLYGDDAGVVAWEGASS